MVYLVDCRIADFAANLGGSADLYTPIHPPPPIKKRVTAPLHLPQSWDKHGYLCLSPWPPDFDPDFDITIHMDYDSGPTKHSFFQVMTTLKACI
jgi:hypothetical protein